MSERRYALTRVESGDYLLPSNDGASLWRLVRYREEGSLWEYAPGDRKYEVGRKVVGWFWATYRYDGRFPVDVLPDDFLEWENWRTWDTLLRTRGEAIESALRGGEGR